MPKFEYAIFVIFFFVVPELNKEGVTNITITTILHPRFKKIYFKSSIALSQALIIICDTLKKPTDHLKSIPTPNLIGVSTVIL